MNAFQQFAIKIYTVAAVSALPFIGYMLQQPVPKTVTITGNKTEINLPIKDEGGKVLQHQDMINLTRTGDYKVIRTLDKNKQPYLLVKKAPGFAPRPQSAPVVVKPNR
ncbi:hypothetical protein [Mucilaginibacter sp. PAMB04168]|uniref:hypothetical protein n=1 Tax=Mucilaginibacter sp. PAMB04168 TaxID=3138567 RepID=UPI0031F6ADF2